MLEEFRRSFGGIPDRIMRYPHPAGMSDIMDQHTPGITTMSVRAPAHDGREMTYRGDLADPHDIDHQAMVEAEHAAMGHGAHGGHDKHAGHSVEMFRSRFWISLLLSIPVVLYSPMVQEWLRFSMPAFPGSDLVSPVLGTIVFFYGGSVFLKGGWDELRSRTPGMMLLISLAITVAFIASAATTLGFFDLEFWWELALLVTIMLLGHWQEMRAIGQAQGALGALAALLPDEAERVTATGSGDRSPCRASRRRYRPGPTRCPRAGRRRDRRRFGRAG